MIGVVYIYILERVAGRYAYAFMDVLTKVL